MKNDINGPEQRDGGNAMGEGEAASLISDPGIPCCFLIVNPQPGHPDPVGIDISLPG